MHGVEGSLSWSVVPGTHCVHTVTPTALYVPGEHATHAVSELLSVSALPAGHANLVI